MSHVYVISDLFQMLGSVAPILNVDKESRAGSYDKVSDLDWKTGSVRTNGISLGIAVFNLGTSEIDITCLL